MSPIFVKILGGYIYLAVHKREISSLTPPLLSPKARPRDTYQRISHVQSVLEASSHECTRSRHAAVNPLSLSSFVSCSRDTTAATQAMPANNILLR
jgi:hypothetical protein